MKISSDYCMSSRSCTQSTKNQKNVQSIPVESRQSSGVYSIPFCSLFHHGPKDTDRTPWGTTYGEERVARQEAEAYKRMIQRETMKESRDAWVREEAENVGKNPIWDEYLTQREFRRYHEEEMQRRAARAAHIASMEGVKQYGDGNSYKICDSDGYTIEEGVGNKWTKRTEYLGGYNKENRKDYYPDGTWVHNYSCLFQHYGKEIGRPDGSIEFYKRTTNELEKIEYRDGGYKEMQMPHYMFKNPEDAVKKEVTGEGTVIKYDLTNYYHEFGRPDGSDKKFWAKNYKTKEEYPDGTTRTFKYDKAFNLREIKERDGSITKVEIDPNTSNNYVVVEKDSPKTKEVLPDGTIVKYDIISAPSNFRTYQRFDGYTYYEKRYRTEDEYPDGTKKLYKYDDNLNLESVVERDGSITKVGASAKA